MNQLLPTELELKWLGAIIGLLADPAAAQQRAEQYLEAAEAVRQEVAAAEGKLAELKLEAATVQVGLDKAGAELKHLAAMHAAAATVSFGGRRPQARIGAEQ